MTSLFKSRHCYGCTYLFSYMNIKDRGYFWNLNRMATDFEKVT